jgi:hypothetical protein
MWETSASAATVTGPGIYEVRRPLGRMGAPYGQYLLDDLVRGRFRAKLYVFLNAWQLSSAQRKAIRAHTKGAACVWCYAPALHDGDRTAPETMQELTGFHLVRASAAKAWATPTDQGRQLGLQTSFGVEGPVTPLFAAADATPAETLATYPDGTAAVALRKTGERWSLFVGAPGLTSELLRLAARKTGAHLFTQTDCNVYANGPLVALHAAQDGSITLDTGRHSAIHDAITDQVIGTGPSLTLSLEQGDTRIFRY